MANLIVMNAMTAKSFLDTNIVLYTIGQDKLKTEVARSFVVTVPSVNERQSQRLLKMVHRHIHCDFYQPKLISNLPQ